ncbi:hypothetical protein NQ117_05380 [Paenibacillus sp. SC116]|uniref:hypothetical protein n=1 Tax=Paenibacillus sp. SC116 TaxID=2968986 RepID=UPI00215A84AF|nr:hypothetical protein [Paenibacillus sp. SC116]MCR8843104.1 hypothetical protein [Paenibacillus sp. SC116]
MAIEWFDNRPQRRAAFVSTDRQRRLHLSSGTRAILGITEGEAVSMYVGFDHANKRIAVARPDVVRLTDTRTMRFDGKRYYAAATSFVSMYELPHDKAYRYDFAGKDESTGAIMFQLAGYDAPDDHNRKPASRSKGKKSEA